MTEWLVMQEDACHGRSDWKFDLHITLGVYSLISYNARCKYATPLVTILLIYYWSTGEYTWSTTAAGSGAPETRSQHAHVVQPRAVFIQSCIELFGQLPNDKLTRIWLIIWCSLFVWVSNDHLTCPRCGSSVQIYHSRFIFTVRTP